MFYFRWPLPRTDQGERPGIARSASAQFQRLLADNGITCSMNRAVNVWDNSAMESCFSSPKTELTAVYRSRDQARADIFDDIGRFTNPRRRHSKPGDLGPMAFGGRAMFA